MLDLEYRGYALFLTTRRVASSVFHIPEIILWFQDHRIPQKIRF